jgi:hypothetical protein
MKYLCLALNSRRRFHDFMKGERQGQRQAACKRMPGLFQDGEDRVGSTKLAVEVE